MVRLSWPISWCVSWPSCDINLFTLSRKTQPSLELVNFFDRKLPLHLDSIDYITVVNNISLSMGKFKSLTRLLSLVCLTKSGFDESSETKSRSSQFSLTVIPTRVIFCCYKNRLIVGMQLRFYYWWHIGILNTSFRVFRKLL